MKWFFCLVQCLLLASALFLPAYAAEAEDPPPEGEDQILTATTETEGGNITVNVTLPPLAVPEPEPPAEPELPPEPVQDAEWQIVPYATYALDTPVLPEAEASTLKDTLTALFGPYTPRTQTVTEHLADGSSVTYTQAVPGLAGLDWSWLASVGLFALFLYSLLRMIGGLLKL